MEDITITVFSLLIALLIGAGIIIYLGESPITAYYYLFSGAYGSKSVIVRTLLEATPMIFTGLAVLFAYKGGQFNIGAQGQMIIAGLTAAALGAFAVNPILSNAYIILIIAGLAGGLWALIVGFLKAALGVHEVISAIMLNYIAVYLEQYLLNYTLKMGGPTGPNPQTPPVQLSARLFQLAPNTREYLNIGLIIAILAVIAVWFIFKKTSLGYEIKSVGFNPTVSENAGINVKWIITLAMTISGFLAGLAGAERVLGGVGQFTYKQGLIANLGFDGIAVALLGKNNPFGALIAAILLAGLRVGGRSMQFNTNVPSQIVIMIQAIIILLIAAENMFRVKLKNKGV